MLKKTITNSEDYSLSFVSLLKKRTIESKDKPAFVFKDQTYTWVDVDIGSRIVSNELKKIGVKEGTHVGICGLNSINWVFTFFGILKLGAIAVLINPGLNPKEVSNICKIGGVTVLCYSEIEGITTFKMYADTCMLSNQIKGTFDFGNSINFLSNSDSSIDKEEPFKDKFQSDDPCLIIYTSGSTSKPKAVLTSAYSLMYSITHVFEKHKYSSDDKILAFLPYFHVFGLISSLIAGLLIGCCSIIPSSKSPNELIDLIYKYKVTIFNSVPTMMLSIVGSKDFEPKKLASLRSSVLGGSATSKDQMVMLRKILPNVHFGNIYGMSENACISITDYNVSIEHLTETVGKPLDGTIVVIKDNQGNLVKNGIQGEICIKSAGMLVWYYKLPIEMQPIDNDGFLRTGDLGFIDKDGYIRLTGRIKELIISGGENISPNEVAEAIYSLNYFTDVKVVGIPDDIKGEVVAAAVITKSDYRFDETQIKNELSKILSKYKIPRYFKQFDSFPLLGTGKIDKLSLVEKIISEIKK